MKCIEIMLHDDGTFMVRECEPEMKTDMEGGQTFDNAEDAMAAGMEMLRSGEGAASDLEHSMSDGYNKVAGNRAAGLKPPMGGMMGEET